jgi:hypothetical protein
MYCVVRRSFRRSMICLSVAVVTIACGAVPQGNTGPSTRVDLTRMDTTELRGHNYATVYDAISVKHADWYVPRGGPVNGVDAPSVGVFFEYQRRNLGLSYLHDLRPEDVKGVRHLSPTESLSSFSWPWGAIVITLR